MFLFCSSISEASAIGRYLWNKVSPHILPLLKLVLGNNIHTPEEAGANMAFVGMRTEVRRTNGVYFENGGEEE